MIAIIAALGVSVTLLLSLLRLFAGVTLYDRLLAAIGAAIKAALICAALAVALRIEAGVDVAFALVFGALATSAAVLKFFRARTFQAPLARAGRGEIQ